MLTPFLGDQEQDPMLRQLVFAMNVGRPGEMTAADGMTAKAMKVKTEEVRMMIGTAASDMVQGAQSEMDTVTTMMTEVGSQGVVNTGNRKGSGDGRDRGQWTQGMAEMKNDVEWDDTQRHIPSSIPLGFPVHVRVWSMLIKIGLALVARWSPDDCPFDGLAPAL
jgi:hypothetical protein